MKWQALYEGNFRWWNGYLDSAAGSGGCWKEWFSSGMRAANKGPVAGTTSLYIARIGRVLIAINPENPQPRYIQQIVNQLREGAVICYPTDTIYGIGCDISNHKAIMRIHQLKRRPKHQPFSFMCSSLKEASSYGHISNMAYRIMKRSLPGPYTFVLPAMKIVPKIMISRQKTVGIRVPDNAICLALIEALGNPILNTSAAMEEEGPFTEAFEIEERWGKLIDVVIDGGPVYPEPSSVISMIGAQPEVLRVGKGAVDKF
jgi:tRNA threonylcarbamoyl adenosine modification protein (Sua5/YciO/YrdC/YwlC family)